MADEDSHVVENAVLIRLKEWTEWLPMQTDDHADDLSMAGGYTALKADDNERLVELHVTGTGRNYRWEEEIEEAVVAEGEDKPTRSMRYGLYAFQGLFARNVPADNALELIDSQAKPMAEELQRDKEREQDPASKLVIVDEHGGDMRPNKPKVKRDGRKQQARGGRRKR